MDEVPGGMAAVPAADARAFEATLYPNQPVGRRGFTALMLGLSSVSVLMGAGFAVAGAWPVAGFLGLDLLLLYIAFRVARTRARRREHIRLDDSGLVVRHVAADGATREWRFEPYWVRVLMDDPPRRDSWLTLASHSLSLRVGMFLTPKERLDLARALRSALRQYR
jgi:uncharacterized membrane protein